jgi:hypothetical protein
MLVLWHRCATPHADACNEPVLARALGDLTNPEAISPAHAHNETLQPLGDSAHGFTGSIHGREVAPSY